MLARLTVQATLLVFAVIAPALAAPDWSKARSLTVVASDYKFTPSTVSFEPGVVYRLHLENHGTETHEFHAAEFFKAATLRDPGVLNADKDEVVLQPGDAKDVFLVAPPAGHYKLFCPDHDWAGMIGEIVVK